jgi:hypothetical protein
VEAGKGYPLAQFLGAMASACRGRHSFTSWLFALATRCQRFPLSSWQPPSFGWIAECCSRRRSSCVARTMAIHWRGLCGILARAAGARLRLD